MCLLTWCGPRSVGVGWDMVGILPEIPSLYRVRRQYGCQVSLGSTFEETPGHGWHCEPPLAMAHEGLSGGGAVVLPGSANDPEHRC